jgi:hypothetical protein
MTGSEGTFYPGLVAVPWPSSAARSRSSPIVVLVVLALSCCHSLVMFYHISFFVTLLCVFLRRLYYV